MLLIRFYGIIRHAFLFAKIPKIAARKRNKLFYDYLFSFLSWAVKHCTPKLQFCPDDNAGYFEIICSAYILYLWNGERCCVYIYLWQEHRLYLSSMIQFRKYSSSQEACFNILFRGWIFNANILRFWLIRWW